MRPIPGPETGPSSFLGKKHWKKPDYAFQYPSPGTLAQGSCLHHSQSARQVLPCFDLNSKRSSGAGVVHLLDSVRGAGVPPRVEVPSEARRALW